MQESDSKFEDKSDSDLDELSGSFENTDSDNKGTLLAEFAAQLGNSSLTVPATLITPTTNAYITTFSSATLTKDSCEMIDTDLYFSGASRHMSGYRH